MVSAVVTVFLQGLSRSTAAAIELLGNAFGGIVVSDRFSAYNHMQVFQRQLCWAHLIRDLNAITGLQVPSADFGAELLDLQQQLSSCGIATKTARSTGPRCSWPAGRSVRRLWPRCSGWCI
ncbi:transposase [Synechococcus sp. Tobar12-5m-g]|nr:transposase [Synechococcus sp. Cruz CV-v-12]MCP9773644.1 transposase [Synechococcus sp. Tobar12-5m-g]